MPDFPVEISTVLSSGDFPVGAKHPIAFVDPGDRRGRWLVATQEGAILVFDGSSRSLLATPFLDLRASEGGPVEYGGERGLLALAVEPDYEETGRFYVYYTRNNQGTGTTGDIVVARYERSAGNPDVADSASAATILLLDHPASNHNGGWLAFGPDGFLYLSVGDGGGSCDGGGGSNCDPKLGTVGDGQCPTTLLGKILRIDVRGVDPKGTVPDDCSLSASGYTIPTTNPYAGMEPACDEVWALGLRNPFRFSFDRMTGDLFIGDVGQRGWEEINLQAVGTPAPVNFGWVCREGCETAGNDDSNCSTAGCPVDPGTTCEFPRTSGYWDPMLCHYNGGTLWRSIMGGYRYRGARVPSLAGDYLYSDAYCGQIWKTTSLDPSNPAAVAASCWASGFRGTYGFAEDSHGELYVVVGNVDFISGAGRIDCIHNGAGCPWAGAGIFNDDFESMGTDAWSFATP